MEAKTLGLITIGQVVGRGVQEVTPWMDTKVGPIVGQPVSRIVEIVGGGALMYMAVKGRMSSDAQLTSAIIGSRLVTDEVIDIAKGYLAPGTRLPMVRVSAPTARVSVGGVPEYSNSGLVTVD